MLLDLPCRCHGLRDSVVAGSAGCPRSAPPAHGYGVSVALLQPCMLAALEPCCLCCVCTHAQGRRVGAHVCVCTCVAMSPASPAVGTPILLVASPAGSQSNTAWQRASPQSCPSWDLCGTDGKKKDSRGYAGQSMLQACGLQPPLSQLCLPCISGPLSGYGQHALTPQPY